MKAIVATAWNKPIFVKTGKGKKRLRNWYSIEVFRGKDNNDFTWGYYGQGPHNTAYSILREFFGREIAVEKEQEFVNEYISMIDQNHGFIIDSAAAAKLLQLPLEEG